MIELSDSSNPCKKTTENDNIFFKISFYTFLPLHEIRLEKVRFFVRG